MQAAIGSYITTHGPLEFRPRASRAGRPSEDTGGYRMPCEVETGPSGPAGRETDPAADKPGPEEQDTMRNHKGP
eukprot:7552240-Pyramimonas_sp.AAC.1